MKRAVFIVGMLWTVLLLAVALMPAFTSTVAPLLAAQRGIVKPGEPAPNFQLRDMNGQAVSLSDLRGKIVLVNFWATW
ncbi:MAG TPA: redoxin domain-containing protein, partial [Nitrospira sp.]|nr:redoxin domain-containing protein [Nitrospira sp.]